MNTVNSSCSLEGYETNGCYVLHKLQTSMRSVEQVSHRSLTSP